MRQDLSRTDSVKTGDPSNASRRAFLRGAGVALALPAFESMLPSVAAAATKDASKLAVTATGAPLRMAYVYVPNGVHQGYWWPKKEGKDFELNKTLEPLAKVKEKIQLLGGLDQINATAGPDGPGDHARASGSFLTGVRVKKTAGADIHAGISVDQVAAQRIGHLTRFPSLELTCDSVRKSGSCDSGYSCAYQYNLSWSGPTLPVAPEPNPRLVFERLFGAGAPAERRKNLALRREQERSILDFVLEDTRKLENELGGADQQKLDEYLAGVREIERRIQEAERFKDTPNPAVDAPTRHSRHLSGPHPAHVRHDGPGVPDRFHPHRDIPARQRRQQPNFPGNRHFRGPSQLVASLRQEGNDGENRLDRPLVHPAIRQVPREARCRSKTSTGIPSCTIR